jgi:hypothetical protein
MTAFGGCVTRVFAAEGLRAGGESAPAHMAYLLRRLHFLDATADYGAGRLVIGFVIIIIIIIIIVIIIVIIIIIGQGF